MRVENMVSEKTGKAVPNQFIVHGESGAEYFQSYDSIIVAKLPNSTNQWGLDNGTYLDKYYWNYSVTTGKYRNQFLGEGIQETRKKIESGEYVLANLN